MAEVLGIMASIIAVIQVAGEMVSLGYGHRSAVEQTPDIHRLIDELKSFGTVLTTLQLSIQGSRPEFLRGLERPLQECLIEMTHLVERLRLRNTRPKKMLAHQKWPLKEKETWEFLERIERHKSTFILTITFRSNIIKKHVQDTNVGIQDESDDTLQTAKKGAQVLDWLSPGAFDKRHAEIRGKRSQGTGRWILGIPEVQDWLIGTGCRLLWGHGILGSGKSFLCSFMIDHLQDQSPVNNYGVAYIYFDHQNQDGQGPIDVLSSLVKQLACQMEDMPQEIEYLHGKLKSRGYRPTLQGLYTILLLVAKSFPRTFLIFDALDECNPQHQRRSLLPLFHRMAKDGISLFLTSRQYPEDIQHSLQNSAKIELRANGADIASFIEERINENPRVFRLVQQGNLKDRIVSDLTDCAHGMFLLVHPHIEYLCQQTTCNQILVGLEKLKRSSNGVNPLAPTYNRALEIIRLQPRNCVDLAFKTLSWLAKTRRALTVRELQHAVSIEQDYPLFSELDLPDRTRLLDVCAGLVTIDEKSDTVQFAHYTVQEYLLMNSVIPEDADSELAMACIILLSSDIFTRTCTTRAALETRYNVYPFLDYAVQNLSSHLRSCNDSDGSLMTLIHKFLESPGSMLSFLQAVYAPKGYEKDWGCYPRPSRAYAPLHVAVIIGHRPTVQLLLKDTATLVAGAELWEAMRLASSHGHEAVVQLLLDKGADISATDDNGMTVIHWAAKKGHELVVRTLLDHGAHISATDNLGETALHLASYEGYESIVRLLLENEADISTTNNAGETAIHSAAAGGHESVVLLLLGKGADISVTDKEGQMALHLAAMRGHESVVLLLLEKGADISVSDNRGETPLHWAAIGGYESLVLKLIVKGADPTIPDKRGWTPMQWAENRKHVEIIHLLKTALDQQTSLGASIPNRYKLETEFFNDHVVHEMYQHDAGGQQGPKVRSMWKLRNMIGSGAFGIVSLEQSDTGKLRAVKRLTRGLGGGGAKYAREIHTLAQLIDHQYLFVQLFGWYEDRDFAFIAMEYIKHGDLAQYLEKNTPAARKNARAITTQLLEGLIVLHARKISHRDLKPQNVLIACEEPIWVKIADFGISKCEEGAPLKTIVGTNGYMAPELQGLLPRKPTKKGRPMTYTNAVDIWSLGCLVHKVLTSELPFQIPESISETSSETESISGAESVHDSKTLYETETNQQLDFIDISLLNSYCHGKEEFPVEPLVRSGVSANGIMFVKGLLLADPRSRMPAKTEALENPWLLEEVEETTITCAGEPEIPQRLPDADFESIPDMSPPLNTLTNNKCLEVSWEGLPLDLSGDPHVERLHIAEIRLASVLNLSCASYLTYKRRIFQMKVERERMGLAFRKTDSYRACNMDFKRAAKLWDAYANVDWFNQRHIQRYI